MHVRLALVAMFATACYAPNARPGAPCGPGGECPANLACVAGICGGTEPGDATLDDDAAQVAIDAPPDGPSYVPWGTPVLLTSLETPGSGETDPSVTADKLTAVLSADSGPSDADIYIATRAAVTDTFTFTLLTALNSVGFEDQSAEISADGRTIYFTSDRSGQDEVYISTFDTVWSTPTIAVDLSSSANDGDVAISPDGLTAAVLRKTSPQRIYIYTRANTTLPFSGATLHAELNVTSDIASPTITNGAAVIYLQAGSPRDIYRASRVGNGTFTTPVPVTELNVPNARDAAPFVLQGDDYMIFERAGDIYETTR